MSADILIGFDNFVPEEKPLLLKQDRPTSLTVTTVGLAPGRYVIDVVKQEDGTVLIGYIGEDGCSRLFRKLDDTAQD